MSAKLRTELQETGRMPAYGQTLASVVRIVNDLGIDPHDVRFRMGGFLVVEREIPNRGIFNDEEPDDLSDHPDHPDAA